MPLPGVTQDTADLSPVERDAELLKILEVDDMDTLSSDWVEVAQKSASHLRQSNPDIDQISPVVSKARQ